LVIKLKTKSVRVKDHFESIASHYSEELPEFFQKYLLERKMEFILRYFNNPNKYVGLDIGCGQGKYLQFLNRRIKNVIGLDLSFNNVKNTLELKYNNHAINSDGSRLPFKSNIFDFCYCINVIHHLPSRKAQEHFIDEMFRIVKPNGLIFIFDLSMKNPIFAFYLKKIFPKIRSIDEGDELFFNFKDIVGLINSNSKLIDVEFYSFVPDFSPKFLSKFMMKFEKLIEKSKHLAKYAMHQIIILKKL